MRIKDFGVVQVPAGAIPKQDLPTIERKPYKGCPLDQAIIDATLAGTYLTRTMYGILEDEVVQLVQDYEDALFVSGKPSQLGGRANGGAEALAPLRGFLWRAASNVLSIPNPMSMTLSPPPAQGDPLFDQYTRLMTEWLRLGNLCAPIVKRRLRLDAAKETAARISTQDLLSRSDMGEYFDALGKFEVSAAECEDFWRRERAREHKEVLDAWTAAWQNWRRAKESYAAELAAWQAAPESTPKSPLALAAALAAAGFAVAGPAGAVGGGVVGLVAGGGTVGKGPPPMDPGPEPMPPAGISAAEVAVVKGQSVIIGAGR